ncbi:MAG TPA: hypothetical protein VGJ81_09095 [Thermoanaerobaculia bacterium]|jgi:hypothetical protein
MTTKRKAELQRRLSMASVAKPPAGLADRIKADIPDLLGTTRERERLSSSVAFNLRVAASIILLISSAYLCVQLLSRADRSEGVPPMARMAVKTAPAKLPVTNEAPAVAAEAPKPQVARASEPELGVRLDSTEDRDLPQARNEPVTTVAAAPTVSAPAAPPPMAEAAPALAEEKGAAKVANGVEGGVEGQVAGRASGGVVSGVGGGIIGGVVPTARAMDFVQAPPHRVLGISVDVRAFPDVRDAIERGERPRTVNVEALINYFAGPPEHRAPREVGLEVEASPAPVTAGPRSFIIRTTIDTARQEMQPGASVPPVATDVRLEIDLDGNAVVSHRRAGSGDELSGFEPTLLKNVSVTALYEVELRDNLPWHQPIATVRLHYRSVVSGKERTITRIMHASDVARPWSDASRRHRLATLGAVWGETLKNAPGATDVARRAEELANQEPRDAKARELAMLATASSRLQSSGPTGSGR